MSKHGELCEICEFLNWPNSCRRPRTSFSVCLRKVSYLALSVKLTVKRVLVNKSVVQYDWSMLFKGRIKRCNTLQVSYQNNPRALYLNVHYTYEVQSSI